MRDVLFARVLTAALFISVACAEQSLAQDSKKEPSGVVSGRVMLGDKPLPRVSVILTPSNPIAFNQRPVPARAMTDEDGNYRVTKVPPGSYNITPYTPAFVVAAEGSYGQPGKSVTLAEGEEVHGVDFSLTKGGVITGRVTDGEGRPVIEQRVTTVRVDERGQRLPGPYFNPFMFSTDDRGVYRLYGLTPGRYKVSVGDAPDSGIFRVGFGGGTYKRTFHPDVTDEARAAIIEVRAGGEAGDIDIKAGGASKTFAATGHVIDADTGKPLPNLTYGFGALTGQQSTVGAYGWTNNRTSADGQFRIEGLNAGRYAAFVVATEQVDFYSEPAVFEVNDSDVSGLEIKVRRGSSVNGLAVIEGSTDADVLAQISKLELRAFVQTQQVTAPTMAPIPISPDGSFGITGLRPGKVRIMLGGYPPPKGFSLLRVERDGVPQGDGIEIGTAENVSGVRVIIGFGSGAVRGQIKVLGGETTPDLRFRIIYRRIDSEVATPSSTTADSRGRFSIEGLMPGQYEIEVQPMYVTPSSPAGPPAPGRLPQKTLAKQNITVADGAETEVTLTIDLGNKDKGSDR